MSFFKSFPKLHLYLMLRFYIWSSRLMTVSPSILKRQARATKCVELKKLNFLSDFN